MATFMEVPDMISTIPMHNVIALDIARKIAAGSCPVGTRISGRSLLSGNYNVSPETIRKAISLLRDANVVTVSQGKEAVVESVEQAYSFLSHFEDRQFVFSLKQEVETLLAQKQEIDKRLEEILREIISYSDRFKNLRPYNPIEVVIPADSHVVGRSIGDLRLRDSLGAAVLAVKREPETIVSPPNSTVLQAGDKIVVVGEGELLQRLTAFFGKE